MRNFDALKCAISFRVCAACIVDGLCDRFLSLALQKGQSWDLVGFFYLYRGGWVGGWVEGFLLIALENGRISIREKVALFSGNLRVDRFYRYKTLECISGEVI